MLKKRRKFAMKAEHKIILFSLLFGLIVWILDIFVDSVVFYKLGFIDFLAFHTPIFKIYAKLGFLDQIAATKLDDMVSKSPVYKFYIRFFTVFFFMLFGFYIARLVRKIRIKDEELEAAEQEKATVLNSLNECVIYHDTKISVLWSNRAARQFSGLDKGEQLKKKCHNLCRSESNPCPECPVVKAFETGRVHHVEIETPDRKFWSVRGYPVFDYQKEVKGVVEVAFDITEQKTAEIEIKKTAEHLKALYDVSKKINAVSSKKEILGWISEEATRLLEADECVFVSEETRFPEGRERTDRGVALLKQDTQGAKKRFSDEISRRSKPLLSFDGMGTNTSYFSRLQKTAAEEIPQSALSVPMIVGCEMIGTINVARKEPKQFTSRDAEILSAFSEMASIAFGNIELIEHLEETKDQLKSLSRELERKVEERTKELQELHRQLVRSERLAATGKLAAGIAHEINNPLQAIDSFISAVLKNIKEKSEDGECLKLAQEGINRISAIVKQLLTFHHPDTATVDFVDINHLVERTILLAQNQLSLSKIRVKKKLSPDISRLRVSSQQIHQVLLNLILNAEDAMPHGGELTVRTKEDFGVIYIEVSDTGVGMSEEVIERVFEPFFTTKKERGTGLGLSVSYGIVKSHGGDMLIESKPGKGTIFTVKLPVNK